MALGDRTREGLESWFTRKSPTTGLSWSDRLGQWTVNAGAGILEKIGEKADITSSEKLKAPLLEELQGSVAGDYAHGILEEFLYPDSGFKQILADIVYFISGIVSILLNNPVLVREMSYIYDSRDRSYRLDPISVITAWRRDPSKYEHYLDDLRVQGWSDDRIEALKFFTEFVPNAADQVNWLAREVYEPDMISKYGLDDELPVYENTDFSKIGVTPEQMTNYWRAHWQHATFIQLVEMLHRGLINEDDVYEWYRLVEIPPYWRDKLTEIAYTWPTRVDIRRFYEQRTISEDRLRQLYRGLGYHGQDLEDYITWTKVYEDLPSLLSRWSKGWLSLEEVRQQLRDMGLPEERVETIIQEKVYADAAERTTSERDVTRSDIFKGVKDERITRDEGIELLMDLGYDRDEADYILAVNVPEDETASAVQNRQLTKSDVLNGLRTEVLTEDEAREKLLELRYRPVDVQLLLDIFYASITAPDTEIGRQESKADIVKAVKSGLITPEEGYLRLQDIGFTPEASDFILQVQAETSPFSPVSFNEFKDLTAKWRKSTGREVSEMPADLKEKADELVAANNQVDLIEQRIADEKKKLIDSPEIPPETEQTLKELQVTLNRAIAERQRLQNEYDAALAAWKAGQAG